MDYASRPLYSKNAPAVFAKKLKTVKLNIVVVIGKARSLEQSARISGLAYDKGYTVLQFTEPFIASAQVKRSNDKSAWELVFEGVPRGHVTEWLPYNLKIRLSPMTPFTVLHRFGDTILPQLKFYRYTDHDRKVVLISSGIDTLAGRNGWLSSIDEASSDLWAKYLLTGKIHFDPDAPPRDGSQWTPLELTTRLQYKEAIKDIFQSKEAFHTRNGGIYQIGL